MKYEWLDEYLLALPGAEKDYKPEWGWFRYMLRGKLFAAVCTPDEKHGTYGGHDLVNLKCDPARGEILRAAHPEILPGPAGGYPPGALPGVPPADFEKAAQIRTEGN